MFASRFGCTKYALLLVLTAGAMVNTSRAAAPSADRLQALINETSAQFEISYRRQPAEGQLRQQQLKAVVAAWRAAPRSPAANEQLATWLRAAIRASMPGSREALPATPQFKTIESVDKKPAQPTTVEPAPIELRHNDKPQPKHTPGTTAAPAAESPKTPTLADEQNDPFRDDPIQDETLDQDASPFQDDSK
jgi:hypothetical protein